MLREPSGHHSPSPHSVAAIRQINGLVYCVAVLYPTHPFLGLPYRLNVKPYNLRQAEPPSGVTVWEDT